MRELSLGERMKMELIAALLHSPEVLFLDEPTIGLDVVAQHNIQKFLKHYQEVRRITILLTSHYMKDVAALCRRVVIIAHGQIMYDGSLDGIVDRFSSHKVLTLQFGDGRMPSDLSRYGEVLELKEPRGEAAGRAQRDRRRAVGGARGARDRGRERRRPAAGRSDRASVRASGERHRRVRTATRHLRGASSAAKFCPLNSDLRPRLPMLARAQTWWTILRICSRSGSSIAATSGSAR